MSRCKLSFFGIRSMSKKSKPTKDTNPQPNNNSNQPEVPSDDRKNEFDETDLANGRTVRLRSGEYVCDMCCGPVSNDGTCINCGMRVIFSKGNKRREIHVEGSNHEEVSKVFRDAEHETQKNAFFLLLTRWSFWIGCLISILGVILVAIGATGETEFSFFGQALKSQNVGVASIFIGASLVVLNIRRLLSSYDKTSRP